MNVLQPSSLQSLHTILNVEDTEAMRYVRSRALTQAGYRVIEASSGEEALLMVATLRPHVVVLDVLLPGIDGREVCRRIKADPDTADIMVLQVSAERTTVQNLVAGLDGGADGYLVEPVDPLELTATVRSLLRLADRLAENRRLIRQLSRTERQCLDATEAADCGLWDWDIPGGRLEWYGRSEQLAGVRPGSFSGKVEDVMALLHPDDRERVERRWHEMVARQERQHQEECRFVHPDGSIRWMRGIGRLFYGGDGVAIRMTGVMQDISERKQAEERQRIQHERLQLLAVAAEQLLSASDSCALLPGVFETVRRHLDLDGYFQYRLEEGGAGLVLEASAGLPEEHRNRFNRLQIGQGVCGTAAALVQPVIVEHLQECEASNAALVRSLGFRAYACHPLVVGERLLGTLSFASRSRDRFVPDEIEFIGTICRYVAAALERLRLQAEAEERAEQLRRSEADLRLAYEGSAVPMAELDPRTGGVLRLNRAMAEVLGCPESDVLGRSFQDFMHPDHREGNWRGFLRLVQGEADRFRVEQQLWRNDGRLVWADLTVNLVRDADGRPYRVAVVLQDSTQRKAAEDKRQLYRALIEHSTDGIAIIDPDGRYLEQNRAHRLLLGYSDEDLLGQTPAIHAGPEQFADIVTALTTTGVCRKELTSRCKDGALVTIALSAFAIRDSHGDILCYVGTKRNITEEKRAEEVLRRTNESLSLAQDASNSGIWDWDLEADEVYVSPQYRALYGLPPDARVDYQRWLTLVHPDDRPDMEEAGRRLLASGREYRVEFRVDHPLIGLRWLAGIGTLTRDETGKPLRFSGINLDITERKLAEKALESAHERLSLFIESLPVVSYTSRKENRFGATSVSQSIRAVTGYDPDTFIHDSEFWASRIHPDDRPSVLEGVGAVWERGHQYLEYRWKIRDGSYRWFADWVRVIRRPDRGSEHITGIWLDITDRKSSEEALRLREAALQEREQELRIITDSVPSCISYVDAEERYVFVNAGYERLFGRPRHQIVGSTVTDLLGPSYAKAKPYIARALAGELVHFEAEMVYAGQPVTAMVSYTPNVRPDGRTAGFYVLATDISARKCQEDELRRLKEELEERVSVRTGELTTSQDRLRRLASQLVLAEQRERRKLANDLHDYLAQLLVVGKMKMTQLRKPAPLQPAAQVMADDVEAILQQALTYTRTMIVDLSPPSLQDDGLPSALQWLAERMHKDGLQVEISVNASRVALPEDRALFLFQSVRELLFNILKHAGVDRAFVTLAVEKNGDLRLTVADRGKGFPADTMARAAKSGHLGLSSVRERMEAMGGRIEITSAPGQGTTVTLVLPGTRNGEPSHLQ